MFMVKKRDPGYVDLVDSTVQNDTVQNVTIDGTNYRYIMYDQCFQQQWYPNQVEFPLLFVVRHVFRA